MIPLREIKTHLKIEHEREDYYLVGLEEQAVAYLERQTSAYYGPPVETINPVVGTGTADLPCPGPVLELAELIEVPADGSEIPVPVHEGVFEIGFETLVRIDGSVWEPHMDYQATYLRGYLAGTEPGDVRTAVMQIVCHWYERRNAVGTGAALPLSARSIILSRRRQRA